MTPTYTYCIKHGTIFKPVNFLSSIISYEKKMPCLQGHSKTIFSPVLHCYIMYTNTGTRNHTDIQYSTAHFGGLLHHMLYQHIQFNLGILRGSGQI